MMLKGGGTVPGKNLSCEEQNQEDLLTVRTRLLHIIICSLFKWLCFIGAFALAQLVWSFKANTTFNWFGLLSWSSLQVRSFLELLGLYKMEV